MIWVIVFCIVFTLLIGYLFYILTFGNFKLQYDNFTIFQGMLGSGKTSLLTHLAIKELHRRRLFNFLRVPIFVLACLIPILNIFVILLALKDKKVPFKKYSTAVYSNYPIDITYKFLGIPLQKKKFSICIDKDFFTYKYKILENSIVVFDELQYILPSVVNKKAVLSDDKLRLTLTYLRHATDCCFFGATQSFGEINVTFRRKVNYIYELSNIKVKKFLKFLPSKVNIRKLTYSEDVASGNISVLEDDKKIRDKYYFYFPYNRFVSRYCKELYNLNDDDLVKISLDYNNLLDYFNCKVGYEFRRIDFKS